MLDHFAKCGIYPATVFLHRPHDTGNLCDVRPDDLIHKSRSDRLCVGLDLPKANNDPDP
jgi:hypothetical protein